jgi:hypothetical protein
MAHDVFLSHSTKDKEVVELICRCLERAGFRCWMAPRDIRPGANWGAAIMQGLRETRIMVLVCSTNVNGSEHIAREVTQADSLKKTIIPLRIDRSELDDRFLYFLGTAQWLDASSPPLEPHLEVLVATVREILGGDATPPPTLPRAPTALLPPVGSVVPPPVVEAVQEERTINDVPADRFVEIEESGAVGSFTTIFASTAVGKIPITIPEAFASAGTSGRILRLTPVEFSGARQPLELHLTRVSQFTLGRSPEADLITVFLPRNEKNDIRSRRLSKIHAHIEYRDEQFWVHRRTGAAVHIGKNPVDDNPTGAKLRERDRLILAEDYTLEVFYDISLQSTLHFTNPGLWQGGEIWFPPSMLGAVRFEPLNCPPALRTSCWLFVDVGFGSAHGGLLHAGSGLAEQQGLILSLSGCFWIVNLVENEKVRINDYPLARNEVAPLTQGDDIWLGAARYRTDIFA